MMNYENFDASNEKVKMFDLTEFVKWSNLLNSNLYDIRTYLDSMTIGQQYDATSSSGEDADLRKVSAERYYLDAIHGNPELYGEGTEVGLSPQIALEKINEKITLMNSSLALIGIGVKKFEDGYGSEEINLFISNGKKFLSYLESLDINTLTETQKKSLGNFLNILRDQILYTPNTSEEQVDRFIELSQYIQSIIEQAQRLKLTINGDHTTYSLDDISDAIIPIKEGYFKEYTIAKKSRLYDEFQNPMSWHNNIKASLYKEYLDSIFKDIDSVFQNPRAEIIYNKMVQDFTKILKKLYPLIQERPQVWQQYNTNEELLPVIENALRQVQELSIDYNSQEENNYKTLESRLSEHLESEEFLQYLHRIPKNLREVIVGSEIDYFILHKDGFNIDLFHKGMEQLVSNYSSSLDIKTEKIKSLMIDSVIDKLGYNKSLTEEEQKEVFSYVSKNYVQNGYFFHGFNGAFEKSIRTKGLTTGERIWNKDDLDTIAALEKKYGARILGWYNINSKENIFMDGHSRNVYHYAVSSPEWFTQFITQGSDTPGKNEDFYRKDYSNSKGNINNLCRNLNIDNDDKEKIMAFFEKYWKEFANPTLKPKAALIKRPAVMGEMEELKDYDTYKDYLKNELNMKESLLSFDNIMDMLIDWSINDASTNQNIQAEDIVIISLPKYNDVCPQ